MKLNALIRVLVAGPMIIGGYKTWNHPEAPASGLGDTTEKINSTLGTDFTSEQLVKFQSGTMFLGGTALALGIVPRLAAAGLVANVVPTTLQGHPFWKAPKDERIGQLTNFLRNGAYVGGLLAVATGYTTGRMEKKAKKLRGAVEKAKSEK